MELAENPVPEQLPLFLSLKKEVYICIFYRKQVFKTLKRLKERLSNQISTICLLIFNSQMQMTFKVAKIGLNFNKKIWKEHP